MLPLTQEQHSVKKPNQWPSTSVSWVFDPSSLSYRLPHLAQLREQNWSWDENLTLLAACLDFVGRVVEGISTVLCGWSLNTDIFTWNLSNMPLNGSFSWLIEFNTTCVSKRGNETDVDRSMHVKQSNAGKKWLDAARLYILYGPDMWYPYHYADI